MSSSAINTQVAQLKIGNVQNQADNSAVYSGGIWSLKNSTAVTSVTITDAGNVGIGTASPTRKLHINGAVNISDGNSDRFVMSFGASGVSLNNNDNSAMIFATSNTERMRIDASGNLLVGTTTSPQYGKFSTNGNSQVWNFGANSLNSFNIYCNPAVGGNYGVYLVAGGTSWTANSDERLKDISGEIKDAVNTIKTLRAIHYTLKADEQEVKTQRIGLVAQEVKAVIPQIVDENESGYLGIRYTEMVPVLVKAIQELSAKNEALEARLAALEAK